MEILLVGGAIRDELLGLPVKDNDWLVVGGTPQYFIDNKYEQVGNDFPVFLHPTTRDEYALARKERKIGEGYNGFEFIFDTTVTAEEDLFRRDLTINAMAKKENGEIIDPFNGKKDLKNKMLRHVSNHFSEDPVRVLRVARFMARYSPLGFSVAPETMELMSKMVSSGEINSLTKERVLLEIQKTFAEPNPTTFFETLRECGALKVILPEVDALYGVPQRKDYHPEIDCGIHTMMSLEQAKVISNGNFDVMFSALVHDLGKAITPKDILPRHVGHEKSGVPLTEAVCKRLKVSSYTKKLALLTTEYHLLCHKVKTLKPPKLYNLLTSLNAFKDEKLVEDFAMACKADARGRTGFENVEYDSYEYISHILNHVKSKQKEINKKSVSIADSLVEKGELNIKEKGIKIGEFRRLLVIESIINAISILPEKLNLLLSENIDNIKNFSNLETKEQLNLFNTIKAGKGTLVLDKILEIGKIELPVLVDCVDKFSKISGAKFVEQGLKNIEVGIAINKEKVDVINEFYPSRIIDNKINTKSIKP
jgi:tRNA nucleotidyltransferase (CCA-adding enzyme)